ncbi:MAG TPA: SLATT domain-containing protein [Aggregatilineaceae bacterium]|nr:SLATT domain-containing protein [Aggregatilineaceae bacterium]
MNKVESTPAPTELMPPQEAKLRTQLYVRQRIRHQQKFYQNRVREFQLNSSAMLVVSAVLMFVSSIVSAFSTSLNSPFLALCSAILPAIAGVVAAFRSLYQWERQAMLYEDVQLSLEEACIELPDEDYPTSLPDAEYAAAFPRVVDKGEQAFQNEAAQWGQMQMATMQSKIQSAANAKDDKNN